MYLHLHLPTCTHTHTHIRPHPQLALPALLLPLLLLPLFPATDALGETATLQRWNGKEGLDGGVAEKG